MHFNSLFVLASLAISSYATTVAQVEADIATISSQLTTLDNAITAFSPTVGAGSLLQALTIHNDAVTIDGTISSTTTDVEGVPTPVSDADGQTILNLLLALEPTIDDALTKIVARQAAINALPVGGVPALIALDLTNLNTATNTLENAFLAAAPSSVLSAAQAFQSRVNAAFAVAIDAFN